jgi:predicted AlkP superfamily pyrophosphatase or phosphodiesterase
MKTVSRILMKVAAVIAGVVGVPFGAQAANTYQHVLLISIDGMHALDLTNCILANQKNVNDGCFNLANYANHAIVYPNALSSAPSDSFPGLLALVTGGTPKSTGVFYDNSYDRSLFAPGSKCKGQPGANTVFDETIDKDPTATNAGGTLGQPFTQINPEALPRALVKGACVPVYPHDFIQVNTLFEVVRAHRGRTAWSDKHPAYDLVNGPSGEGVEDLFTPEVNSTDPIYPAITDTTKGFHSVQRNDQLKVQSILNEIDGLDSTGTKKVGVPTIFGMNFQAVSVGQKLAKGNTNDPADAGLVGGYADASGKPNSGLVSGLKFVDSAIGQIVAELRANDLLASTLVIITAKHGQSPIDPSLRQTVDDSPYANTPGIAGVPGGHFTTDDVGLVWLSPTLQQKNYSAAKTYLAGQANSLGIETLLDKSDLAILYENPFGNNRTPDFIAKTKHGLIYTSGTKLAEHGGFANDDRNVALMVYNPGLSPNTVSDQVETRQVAPTILEAFSINPKELDGARRENTSALPGLQ